MDKKDYEFEFPPLAIPLALACWLILLGLGILVYNILFQLAAL
jgi:hypothetical protein